MSIEYTVPAHRWRLGWELHIDGEGVTQTRTLGQAKDQVRSYVSTLHDADESDAVVHLVVHELGKLNDDVAEVRSMNARWAEVPAPQR